MTCACHVDLVQSTKLILKLRENHINNLDKARKNAGLEELQSETVVSSRPAPSACEVEIVCTYVLHGEFSFIRTYIIHNNAYTLHIHTYE